jgi:hypothetical protein
VFGLGQWPHRCRGVCARLRPHLPPDISSLIEPCRTILRLMSGMPTEPW